MSDPHSEYDYDLLRDSMITSRFSDYHRSLESPLQHHLNSRSLASAQAIAASLEFSAESSDDQAAEIKVEEIDGVKVEAGEDAQVDEGEGIKVEASEDAQVEVQAKEAKVTPKSTKHQLGIVKKKKDQAVKLARYWQAMAQKQRATISKLEAENMHLVKRHEAMGHWIMQGQDMFFDDEGEDAKQQFGESFSDCEQRKNFPPVVPRPSFPPVPKPVPKPPDHPPPSYLIRKFKSQTSSSQNAVLGLNKANAIGKKVVKKQEWAKAPMPHQD